MMNRSLVLAGTVLFGAAVAAQTPPTGQQQKPQSYQQAGQQVTITGCLRQTSDDPKLFALVDAKPSQSAAQAKPGEERATGTAGRAMRAPLYRLEDPGTPSLKPHVNKRVEVMGTVTPVKDEKGADVVGVTKEKTIGVTTTTIRAIDIKPAPLLNVTSVKETGDCPAAKPKQ